VRVLLDECLPRRLGAELIGHTVTTVQKAGWAGLVNGALLARIEGAFDAFITIDKNMPAQQRLAGRSFGVIVLRAQSNRLQSLKPLIPEILTVLDKLDAGEIRVIAAQA
jgi:hypothetical protein